MDGAAVGKDDSPNPFSFKSFLKRGEGGTGSGGEKKVSSKPTKTRTSKKKTGSKTPIGAIPFPEDTEVVGKYCTKDLFGFLSDAHPVWILALLLL